MELPAEVWVAIWRLLGKSALYYRLLSRQQESYIWASLRGQRLSTNSVSLAERIQKEGLLAVLHYAVLGKIPTLPAVEELHLYEAHSWNPANQPHALVLHGGILDEAPTLSQIELRGVRTNLNKWLHVPHLTVKAPIMPPNESLTFRSRGTKYFSLELPPERREYSCTLRGFSRLQILESGTSYYPRFYRCQEVEFQSPMKSSLIICEEVQFLTVNVAGLLHLEVKHTLSGLYIKRGMVTLCGSFYLDFVTEILFLEEGLADESITFREKKIVSSKDAATFHSADKS